MGEEEGKLTIDPYTQETQAPGSSPAAEKNNFVFPVKNWDRYQFLSYIGEGGMGRVYKAQDIRLNRLVALKFIRTDDPGLIQRFLREARAQASLSHENICNVFEAGEVDGRQYIAMQFIHGKTLSQASDEMTLEQKVKLIKDVAEGLHAAHRLGLIHRDIKPGNIMVERQEDGRFRPYILDFGLVREIQSNGLTLTGTAVVGTPGYMAPEQAWGEVQKLDRRVDVYSLGSTMYELLSGTQPFQATSTMEILRKLLEDEPHPIRKVLHNIPADLETIVMKCLEREPERRYESARALADDLQRYLNGEPVAARPTGITYRLLKKARKNKTVVAVSSVAVCLLLLLIGYGIHTQYQTRQRQVVAQRFGQQVERMDAIMRIGHTIPLHDIRREKEWIRTNMLDIRSQMMKLGKAAEGPGNYALGRGYLSLNDTRAAKEHLSKAWDSGYREPEVAYALGLAYGKLYQKELQSIENIRNKEVRESRRAEIEKLYRIPAVNYLRSSKLAQTAAPEYAEALIDFYEKRFQQALDKSMAAIKKIPWLYEAKILEANIYMSIANDRRGSGDTAGAMEMYRKVETAFQDASKIGESDVEAYAGLCSLWTNVMYTQIYSTGDMVGVLEKTEFSCGQALKADPDLASIHTQFSNAYWLWAEYQRQHGENSEEALQRSITEANLATRLDPTDAVAYKSLGTAYQMLGDRLQHLNQDPAPMVKQAIHSYSKALEINSTDITVYNSLGNTHAVDGDYKRNTGKDPREDYQAAIETFQKGIDMNPRFAYIYSNLGITYKDLAQYEISHGLDFHNNLKLAIQNYKKALELKPDDVYAYNNLGNSFKIKANEEFRNGSDPTASANEARVVLKKALEINPNYATPLSNLAEVCRIVSAYELSVGKNPSALLIEAMELLNRAGKVKKDDWQIQIEMAQTHMLMAEVEWSRGLPAKSLRTAQAAMKNAGTLISSDYYKQRLGELYILQAREKLRRKKSASQEFQFAKESLLSSIDINSQNSYAYLSFSKLCRWQASVADVAESKSLIQDGLKSADSALALNPTLAEAYAVRGVLYQMMQNSTSLAASRESLEKALTMNRNLQREYAAYR